MQEFDIDEILGDLPGPDFNVAPTVTVPAVTWSPPAPPSGCARPDRVNRRPRAHVWDATTVPARPTAAVDRAPGPFPFVLPDDYPGSRPASTAGEAA